MSHLRLGSTAPDFEADTTEGWLKFHEWAGDSWVSTDDELSTEQWKVNLLDLAT